MRRLRKFISVPAADRVLLLRAAFVLAAVRLGLWLLPSRSVLDAAACQGRPAPKRRPLASPVPAERLTWAIRGAARYIPAATCLTQALALQWLLLRFGHASRVHIGVRKAAGARFEAHAWVECGDKVVIGGPEAHDYIPLAAWQGSASGFRLLTPDS